IAAADGLLFACPEYNFSLTAALKNAIDWASRPPNQAFQDKPAAMFSCTPGPLGGARVQYDLRRILVQLWSYPLPRPEVVMRAARTAARCPASARPSAASDRRRGALPESFLFRKPRAAQGRGTAHRGAAAAARSSARGRWRASAARRPRAYPQPANAARRVAG